MSIKFHCLLLAALLMLAASSSAVQRVPVQAINSSNVTDRACPPAAELADARQQLDTAVMAVLDQRFGGLCSDAVASCSDLPENSTTGYHCILPPNSDSPVLEFCDLTLQSPITSCSSLPADSPAGQYWLLPSTGPPAELRFCNPAAHSNTGGCGAAGWTRVGFLNMSDSEQSCPEDWLTINSTSARGCGRGLSSVTGCSQLVFPAPATPYSEVCGRVVAYHKGTASAFNLNQVTNHLESSGALETAYLDGLSLTHGPEHHRQHIWSFVTALNELTNFDWLVCDCINSNHWPYSLSFVGENYFCDTGNHQSSFTPITDSNDPLWDGEGCGHNNTCCGFRNPPWFKTSLPSPTSNHLEIRNCQLRRGYDTMVTLLEIYVK